MDTANLLKPLNHITPFHFLSRALPFRSFHFAHFKLKLKHKHFHLSLSSPTFCSLSERGNGSSLPCGVGEAASQVSTRKLLQVVLVSPQIPGNTGCIARTCAASAVGLHLVGPLGFQVDDAKLKRAGLDYWPYVVVKVHDSWMEFQDYFRQQDGEKRLLAFTKRGTAIHSDFSYRRGDYLIFGSETSGLPPEALLDCKSETFGGGTIRIPMVETYVRCLNLSVPVIAIAVGSRGLISQLLGPKFGGFLVYGYLEGKSVPGLPTLVSLKHEYLNANTKVFGLISNLVGHSKGPILHNPAFRHTGYNGIYVAMLVDDIKEFFRTYTGTDFTGFRYAATLS